MKKIFLLSAFLLSCIYSYSQSNNFAWFYEKEWPATVVTTNNYTASINNLGALSKDLILKIKFASVNTGASTIIINTSGPISIYKKGTNVLTGGELAGTLELSYDGVNFIILGGTGGGSSTLATLADVNISSPTNTQLLQYQTSDNKFHNVNIPIWNQNTTGSAATLSSPLSDGLLSTPYIKADGTRTLSADWSVGSHKITNLTDPASSQDAATKNYVDGVAAGLSVKTSVVVGTTSALPSNTYSNGASGVGATLTAVSTGVLTIDGQTVALNNRVLVKNEVTQANNGIYICTTAGAIGVAYILTRATDFDQSAEIPGGFTFIVTGSVNANIGYAVIGSGPYTIGTTAITFTQFSGAGSYSNGTGLTLTGTVFAADFGSTSGKVLQGGGPLGTPSSGVGANLTGLTAANITAGSLANGMTATTQAANDNSTKIATTAYANAANTTGSAGSLSSFTGTDARYLQISNNLSDVTASTARTNLGLGTAALISSTAGGDLAGTLPSPTIASGAVTLAKQANLAANSVIGNSTGSSAIPTAVPMTAAATASAVLIRDANANTSANNFLDGWASTATAAGTTTLTVASPKLQNWTGSATQTIVLPVTSTLTTGHTFIFSNQSTVSIIIQSSGANTIQTVDPKGILSVTCQLTSGTGTASWLSVYQPPNPMSLAGDGIIGGTPVNGLATPLRLANPVTYTTAPFTATSNTTLANVTGLSYTVSDAKTYRFVAELYTTSNVAGGVKFAISGTATVTNIIYEAVVLDANTNAVQTRTTTIGTAVGGVTAVTNALCKITGLITVNVGGTLTVQFSQNASNGSASSILQGSSFTVSQAN